MSVAFRQPDVTLSDIEREIRRRVHDDPLAEWYKPYPHQLSIHRDRHPILVIIGANRGGKSWGMVAESLLYATGRATYAPMPSWPAVVWYSVPSLTMFRRSIKPIFKRLVPSRLLKRWYERDAIAEFRGGQELHFVSADMKQKRLQGASIDLAVIDETPEQEIYDELTARIADRHGRIIIGFAPLPEQVSKWGWIRDELYVPWKIGERKDIEVLHMPIADREGRSLVPHFTDEDIQAFIQKYPDPATRAARVYGDIVSQAGLVFHGFDPEVHLVRAFDVPDRFSRWMVVDPQYHRFAALYFAADEYGHYFVTDEYFSQDEPLARRAERLAAIVGKRDRPAPVYVDSANPQDTAELDWHFQRVGAPLGAVPLPFRKRVDDMLLRVQSMLEPDPKRAYPKLTQPPGSEPLFGSPRLLFFDTLMSRWELSGRTMHCSRLLWEIARFAWGRDGRPNKESADGADTLDALAYGCSITAMGTFDKQPEPWRQGLSADDIRLWKLIERADRRVARRVRDE